MKTIRPNLIRLNKNQRLYQLEIPIIGLTGGIATGKTTVSNNLIEKGLPVICADKLIKSIYSLEETKKFLKREAPQVVNDTIDFKKLREVFFTDPILKSTLENYLYSHLETSFKERLKSLNGPLFVIYDVPLLFEKEINLLVDQSICVYAPLEIQRARLRKRDQIEDHLINEIVAQQMDIESKKKKADFIIDNSSSIENLTQSINNFLNHILETISKVK